MLDTRCHSTRLPIRGSVGAIQLQAHILKAGVYTLHQWLQITNVPAPYLLVGHSSGGEYLRPYTWQYPKDVK